MVLRCVLMAAGVVHIDEPMDMVDIAEEVVVTEGAAPVVSLRCALAEAWQEAPAWTNRVVGVPEWIVFSGCEALELCAVLEVLRLRD